MAQDFRQPSDAVVFIRVSGDVHVDATQDWEGPESFEDMEIGTGSGFLVAPSGLVLTNHHVVTGGRTVELVQGREVEVRTEVRRIEVAVGGGGRHGRFEAWVAASDPELDLAVLQITGLDLPFIPLGDSDAIEPGDGVTVLGYPFGRQVEVGRRVGTDTVPEPSVTAGSLSAARLDEEGRTRYLQTDASVNPGSSGGPILDEDGSVVGIVKMKLSPEERGEGAGFGIPVNLAKDFLEGHGLLSQVPGTRLRVGVLHELDWKGIRIEMPDGFVDESPGRLLVDTGTGGGPVSLRVDRVATPRGVARLEEVLLDGRGPPGFVPASASVQHRRFRGRPPRLLGSATGRTAEGVRFRIEYTLLDLGQEQIVARYLGSPIDVAFNLGLLQRSLMSLQVAPLLTAEVRGPREVAFERVRSVGAAGHSRGLPLPAGWSREETSFASCAGLPPPEAGVATSPLGDFTVVFRALSWDRSRVPGARLARACGAGPGTLGPTYARGGQRLGVPLAFWGVVVERGTEILLLEAEAPEAKLRFLREAFLMWGNEVAGAP